MYEFLIFDADHTLFDFDKAERDAITKVLVDSGCEFNDIVLEIYKKINNLLWKQFENNEITQNEIKDERFKLFFEHIGYKTDIKRASENYIVYLSQGCDLLPYTKDIITDLKKHYKIGMLTNGISEVQHPRLDNSELNGVFDAIVVSGDEGVSKPDPVIFDILAQKANFYKKTKMLMIGDSLTSDIKGGINYGIDTCWYNPDKKINDTPIKPKYEISDIRDIYTIL